MWNPGEQVPPVYHHPKDNSQAIYPHWDRYQVPDQQQQDPGLVDYSVADLSSDMQHHHRDAERPFKAYPRTPVTMPGGFYGSQPSYPTSLHPSQMGPGSGAVGAGYSSIPSTCNSPTIPSVPGLKSAGIVHHHHHHHIAMHGTGPITQPTRSPPQAHSSAPTTHRTMMDMTSSIPVLKNESELSRERMDSHKDDGISSSSRSSPDLSPPLPSASQDNSDLDRLKSEDEGFKMPPKKRPHIMTGLDIPKDGSYWEKRKKNNESAKRSREARRMKEEQIAVRVVYLEQENLQLRTELAILKSEIDKLQCMIYNS